MMTSDQGHGAGVDLNGIGSTLAPACTALGAQDANRGEHPPIGFTCPAQGAQATRTALDLAW
jgi:hypothetical protein